MSAAFPLSIHWPDYVEDQCCYIRQDVADELFDALELARLHCILNDVATPRVMEIIQSALSRARGETISTLEGEGL